MLGERSKNWIKKHRLAFGALFLAAGILFCLAWTGYGLHQQMRGVCEYEIIHDGYTEKQALYPADPAVGLTQLLPEGKGETVYGLRMMSATDGRVSRGSYTAVLYEGETPAASCTRDMTELLDGAFVDMLFDGPVVLTPGASYRVQLTFAPETSEDKAGIVYGEGELAQEELALYDTAQGAASGRTAAIQYITNYTGRTTALKLFAPIAMLVFVVLMLGWWLLFAKKAKPHMAFLVLALGLGLVWMLVTPPLAGPDEYVHTANSYRYASGLLGQPAGSDPELLPMRACDAPFMRKDSAEIGPILYKEELDGLLSIGNAKEANTMAEVSSGGTLQPVQYLQYLPQALGFALARVCGLGFYPMLLMGRFFSLLVFVLLTAAAIKITPVGKNLFFAAGLLPSCVGLAAAISADPMVIGIAFVYTALCLAAIYSEKPFGCKGRTALAVLAVLLAPAKAVYLPLVLLCLMIPAQRLGGKKTAALYKAGVLAAAAVVWTMANGQTLAYVLRTMDVKKTLISFAGLAVLAVILWLGWRRWGKNRAFRWAVAVGLVLILVLAGAAGIWIMSNTGLDLTPEEYAAGIQPNGESIYLFTAGYILTNLPQTFKLVVNTLTHQLPVYLQGLLGALPGEPIVYRLEVSWVVTIGLLLVLLLTCLRGVQQPRRLTKSSRRWGRGVVLAVVLLTVAACISWTPINSTIIFGIQGRYFLPVLPLILLLVGEWDSVALKKDRTAGLQLTEALLCGAAALESLLLFAAG